MKKGRWIVVFAGLTVALTTVIVATRAGAHHCEGRHTPTARHHGGPGQEACPLHKTAEADAERNCPIAKCPHREVLKELKGEECILAAVGNGIVCPVMEERTFEITPETPSAVKDGKVYFFCCPPCVDKFLESKTDDAGEDHHN